MPYTGIWGASPNGLRVENNLANPAASCRADAACAAILAGAGRRTH